MADQITKIGRSTIQHGPENDRVYLIRLADKDMPELLESIDRLATENSYGKIFAKIPARWMYRFTNAGYTSEALVPLFFGGREDCHFMAKFFDQQRAFDPAREEMTQVIAQARRLTTGSRPRMPKNYIVRRCRLKDCQEMANLFGSVFESYPFPVEDPEYIDYTMNHDVIYFGVWDRTERLVALSSAEMDPKAENAEMTDFVTAPSHRRKGLARHLLKVMESKMREMDISVAYTIARAKSVGINKTFVYAGYKYGGTLLRNTQICGNLESMNVWHKQLTDQS